MTDNPGADRMRLIHPELGKALDILGEINIEDPEQDDWERVPRAVASILAAGMAWENELAASFSSFHLAAEITRLRAGNRKLRLIAGMSLPIAALSGVYTAWMVGL